MKRRTLLRAAPALLKDGSRVHVLVTQAIGSLQNPMSDAQLEAKFHGLSDSVLGESQTSELIGACWSVASAATVAPMVLLATPQ